MIPFEDLLQFHLEPSSIVISLLELDVSYTRGMSASAFETLKKMWTSASIVLWILGGYQFQSKNPECAIFQGLARAVMFEHPSLKFCSIDVASGQEEHQALKYNICLALDQLLESPMPETEYVQYDKALHISRFVPERSSNRKFQAVKDGTALSSTLENAGRCQLSIKHLGQLQTLYFTENEEAGSPLPEDWIELKVQNYSLNAKVGRVRQLQVNQLKIRRTL